MVVVGKSRNILCPGVELCTLLSLLGQADDDCWLATKVTLWNLDRGSKRGPQVLTSNVILGVPGLAFEEQSPPCAASLRCLSVSPSPHDITVVWSA